MVADDVDHWTGERGKWVDNEQACHTVVICECCDINVHSNYSFVIINIRMLPKINLCVEFFL